MLQAKSLFSANLRQFLLGLSRPDSAPFEIYGARDRGCRPGDDYRYQGFRYVQDPARDVLVREDVHSNIGQCQT